MKNYFKYLFSSYKYLTFVLLGLGLAFLDCYLLYKTIEFTNLFIIVLIGSGVFTMLFLLAEDLKNYRIIKKLLPLNANELKNLFRYLIFIVILLSFFGGRSLMIGNVVITVFLIFTIRNFYIKKFGVLINSLFFFVINLSYMFVLINEINFALLFSDPLIVTYLITLMLIPFIIILVRLSKRVKQKVSISIDYKYKNKERKLVVPVNGLYTYEDLANYLVNLEHKEISLDNDSVGVITYNNQDLLTYNIYSGKCFIYYLNNTNVVYDLVNDNSKQFTLYVHVSGVKRAEELFKRFEGSFNPDFLAEYESYSINSDLESKWLNDLKDNG